MQDMNQMFAFAMRMPKQRLAQELIKPTGAIPPSVAMAALQKMNSVHAGQTQGPTVAQNLASQSGEMQQFAAGGIVRLAEGGDVPRGWNNPEYIKQRMRAWFGGDEPDPEISPLEYDPETAPALPPKRNTLTPTDNYGPAGKTKKLAEQQLNRKPNPDDPMYRFLQWLGVEKKPGDGAARFQGRIPDAMDSEPVPLPEGYAPPGQEPPAERVSAPAMAAAADPELTLSDYLKRIRGEMPDRYAGMGAQLGSMEALLKKQQDNAVPMALMTAGAGMIGRRTPYATEAMGEGIRAGIGQYTAEQGDMRKNRMAMLGLHGKVAGDRETNDARVLDAAVRDRYTDEMSAARKQAGAIGREDMFNARMSAEVSKVQEGARKRAEMELEKDPKFITAQPEEKRMMLANATEVFFGVMINQRPDIQRWMQGIGGPSENSGVRVHSVPWASGGAPSKPGKP